MKTAFLEPQEFCLDFALNDNLTGAPLGLVDSGAVQKTADFRGILGRQAPLSQVMKPRDFGASFSASFVYQLDGFRLNDPLHGGDLR